ncbi:MULTISPECIES: dephospho-CoA kinase [Derxia]|uniref:Dephospho-CoA kinase n=1 Tax=Derxia gummosa DSM 723 TaxID=1121388 RepID=A0A9U5CRM2_9BURK|nr:MULTISPECIES: dephospho-CoA kinase [Derxia]
MIVGLTGGIGSGKSFAADCFARLGAGVIDTDLIAHALTRPDGAAMPAIVAAFGDWARAADGALDRAAMRARVFERPAERARLEAILHPMIGAEVERAAAAIADRHPYLVFVIPLLVEGGRWRDRIDRILVVDCPEDEQLSRVIARNGLAEAQVRAILAAQATRAARLAVADDVLDNAGPNPALEHEIATLHQRYLKLARG